MELYKDNTSLGLIYFKTIWFRTCLFIFFFIVLPITNYESINRNILISSFSLCLIFLSIFLSIYFFYCKNYIKKLTLTDNQLELETDGFFKPQSTLISIKTSNLRIKINEAFFPIPTKGYSVSKMIFKDDNNILFTQYAVGNWTRENMLRIKALLDVKPTSTF